MSTASASGNSATSARPSWPWQPMTRVFRVGSDTTSAKNGVVRSFSETTASSIGIGQGIATVGSSSRSAG